MADDVKIVMFCCNWCSYGGADTAGTARMQYPPNIRVIRVMCSGRIDPQFVLKAFKEGADGVFVAGCHMGDCHYDAGNYKLDRRMRLIYKLVDDMGIGKGELEKKEFTTTGFPHPKVKSSLLLLT